MTHDDRLAALKDEMPPAPKPGGVYRPVVVVGNMAYVSGHGPLKADGTLIVGCLGKDMELEQGKDAARQTGLAILATEFVWARNLLEKAKMRAQHMADKVRGANSLVQTADPVRAPEAAPSVSPERFDPPEPATDATADPCTPSDRSPPAG